MACTCIDQLRNRAERYSTGCDLFSAGDVCVFTLARNRARDWLAHPVVTFTPTDTTDYSTGNASVTLSVGDDTPTVTLALSASTLTHGGALTLTATVSSGGSAVTPGSVTFCDTSYSACLNQAIAGKAQLTSLGVASIKIVPAIGSHTYKAVFAGNSTDSSGTSVTQSVTVSGTYSTTTTISSSGSAGNYSLTGTVVSGASKIVAPSGAVAFVDTSNANYTVASPTLSSSALTQTFTAASSYSTIAVSRDVAVADFNGDGIPDMAVVDQSGEKVYILLGNGDGTFTAASGSPVTVSGSVLVGIAAGDFNDDGNVDLAVTDYYANKVFILLGNGNGTFQTPSSIGVVNEPTEIVTADFNKDGNLDLALVSYSGNEVEVLLGNGSGGFPTTGTFATGSNPYSIAAADLNNDGNMDLVVGNNGASSVTVLLGNGAGSFTQPSGSPFGRRQPVARGSGDRGLQRRRKPRHRRSRFRKYRGINPAGQRRRNLCLAIHSQRPERSEDHRHSRLQWRWQPGSCHLRHDHRHRR